MAYLLDANVFIQAKNLHYGLDFCPAFWEWLIEANAAGSVFSIEAPEPSTTLELVFRAKQGNETCSRLRWSDANRITTADVYAQREVL